MRKVKILFLGGAKRVSIAEQFIASGKLLNLEVEIFGYELSDMVPLASVGQIIIGEKWNSDAIFNHLQETIDLYEINILLPFVDPATKVLAELKEKTGSVYIPVSSKLSCEIFFDKRKSNDWFITNDFPVPGYVKNQFPKIAKPINGSASQGLIIMNDKSALDKFTTEKDIEQYLVQNFINGKEYTVDCFIGQDLEVKSIVPRIRLETSGGEVVKSMTVKHEAIEKLSREIIDKADFVGPITIQFLEDEKGVYLMEINPRYGGGVLASIEAGANSPESILKEYIGLEVLEMTNWKSNLVMMRANREFYKQL